MNYDMLPREELIKEIECWRDLCVKNQIVYVQDIQPYIDEQLKMHREGYEVAAEEARRAAGFHNMAAAEYARKLEKYTFDSTNHFSTPWSIRCLTIPNIYDAVRRFFQTKRSES